MAPAIGAIVGLIKEWQSQGDAVITLLVGTWFWLRRCRWLAELPRPGGLLIKDLLTPLQGSDCYMQGPNRRYLLGLVAIVLPAV